MNNIKRMNILFGEIFSPTKTIFEQFNIQNSSDRYFHNLLKWSNRPLLILMVFLFLASLVVHSMWMMPNHDVAFIFVEAQYLLSGARFYYDIPELNPPLIVLLYCPGVLVAHAASIDPWTGLMIWIHILILLSIILARPTLQWTSSGSSLGIITIFFYFLSVIIPNYHFGQREHLSILLAAPALLLFSAQETGRKSPISENITVWVIGSIAFLIKPFMLIVPSALITIRAIRMRDWRQLFGLETKILLIAVLVYTAIIFIKFPEWIYTAKLASQLYFAYNTSLLETLWSFRYSIICLILIFSALKLLDMPKSRQVFYSYIFFSALLFFLVAVLQRKGFNYHALPTATLLSIVAGYLFLEFIAMIPEFAIKNWRVSLGTLMLSSTLVVLSTRSLAGPSMTLLSEFLSGEFPTTITRIADKRSWLAISRGGLIPLSPSLLLIKGFVGLRSSIQWMVPGIVMLSSGDPAQKIQAENLRRLNTKNLVEDIERKRPFIIGLEKTPIQSSDIPFDLFEFYNQDSEFRRVWSKYILVADIEGWRFFARKDK